MIEGAANARGPYKWTRPDDEQHVGTFQSSGDYAVFLFPAQRNEASFERLTIPASTQRAVIRFDGSHDHVELFKDASPSRAPKWMQWVYLAMAAAVILGAAAFIIYKMATSGKE